MTAGRPLSRRERQAETRAGLLTAAAKVFAARGLDRATLDEVAAEAGYTKGAVYANFRSKDDLVLALLDERFADRAEEMDRAMDTAEEAPEQARAGGEEFGRYVSGDRDWERLFFELAIRGARDEEFRGALVERYRGLRTRMAEVVRRRGAQNGLSLDAATSERIALQLFAIANGLALEQLLEPEAVDPALFADLMETFALGLLARASRGDLGAG